MIDCRSQGICSWNYLLSEDGWEASIRIDAMRETGSIEIDGRGFRVRKHGFASGRWSLESDESVLLSARKDNPFTRTFVISGRHMDAELCAVSTFSREMQLTGHGTDCRIQPRHPFTRRATIAGICPDPLLACFALWLTVLLWRRAASNNAGG